MEMTEATKASLERAGYHNFRTQTDKHGNVLILADIALFDSDVDVEAWILYKDCGLVEYSHPYGYEVHEFDESFPSFEALAEAWDTQCERNFDNAYKARYAD